MLCLSGFSTVKSLFVFSLPYLINMWLPMGHSFIILRPPHRYTGIEQLSKCMTVGLSVPPVGGKVTEAREGGYSDPCGNVLQLETSV